MGFVYISLTIHVLNASNRHSQSWNILMPLHWKIRAFVLLLSICPSVCLSAQTWCENLTFSSCSNRKHGLFYMSLLIYILEIHRKSEKMLVTSIFFFPFSMFFASCPSVCLSAQTWCENLTFSSCSDRKHGLFLYELAHLHTRNAQKKWKNASDQHFLLSLLNVFCHFVKTSHNMNFNEFVVCLMDLVLTMTLVLQKRLETCTSRLWAPHFTTELCRTLASTEFILTV